jgi:hypothetical protein
VRKGDSVPWRLLFVVKFEPHPATSQKNRASRERRATDASRMADDATCGRRTFSLGGDGPPWGYAAGG